MSVRMISICDLYDCENTEGLVLKGCGGKPEEWLDGINELFAEERLLLDGTKFTEEDLFLFDNKGSTCILFKFTDDVKLDMSRLAVWRIKTHSTFGGTWLSDFIDNELGERFEKKDDFKSDCPLIGQNGNIFYLMGVASKTLHKNGLSDKAKEMNERIANGYYNYDEAINVIGEYVNINITFLEE